MIKGNVIEFGYGDVVVGVNPIESCIIITNIKPPLECGTKFHKGEIDVEYGLSIKIYEDNIHDIYDIMRKVNKDNRIVTYKDWTFDFSNYNEESVRVMREAAFNIVDIRCLAC